MKKKRKLPERTPALMLIIILAALAAPNKERLPVPPFVNGGIGGLWEAEHRFIESRYGPFELLTFKNAPYAVNRVEWADSSWKLAAMGQYLGKPLQYAALARLTNQPDGTLLILFEWTNPADTNRVHGVFYHTFLSGRDILIRTRQSRGVDTLEFSCAQTRAPCGKLFFDQKSEQIHLRIIGRAAN